MEHRVKALEGFAGEVRDRLARIETKLDGLCTKSDLSKATADLLKWVLGTAIGLAVAGITVMTFVLNNATPKSPPAQQPIVINVPPTAPAPTAPAR